jgi:signal peptidase I
MENTLLVGDHLVVDRITLAPPAKWMPLVHYREPRRGDIVVFIKPVPDWTDGSPHLFLVKRLIGVPGDHIHLQQRHRRHQRRGPEPAEGRKDFSPSGDLEFLDEFPSIPPVATPDPGEGTPEAGPPIFPITSRMGTWWFRQATTS